jgi:DNA-binding LytR/AlgR family response regulator
MQTKPFIELPTPFDTEFVSPHDIEHIIANNKTIFVTITNQEKKQVKLSFAQAEKLLDHPWFVKCHRSHIINIFKIKEYMHKESKIKLINGVEVPLSETYLDNFKMAKANYCKCCQV